MLILQLYSPLKKSEVVALSEKIVLRQHGPVSLVQGRSILRQLVGALPDQKRAQKRVIPTKVRHWFSNRSATCKSGPVPQNGRSSHLRPSWNVGGSRWDIQARPLASHGARDPIPGGVETPKTAGTGRRSDQTVLAEGPK
ncbi:hypothetical protein KM043_017797 [Ampulex compressa]|nr:hypothetical protein KM043_017797 [Ampulex compressa]